MDMDMDMEQVGHPEGNHIDVLRWCAVATRYVALK